jgi:hypothetical protein
MTELEDHSDVVFRGESSFVLRCGKSAANLSDTQCYVMHGTVVCSIQESEVLRSTGTSTVDKKHYLSFTLHRYAK